MKKIFFLAITGLALFASCTKELDQDPLSNPLVENYYSTPNEFIQAVNGVYSSLRAYPDRQLNLSETRSDNLYAVSDGGVRDWEGINSFHRSISANPYVAEAWNANYNGIFKANKVLEQLALKGSSVIADSVLRKRIQAEARFLRAFFYFDLVRWFGKVPVIEKAVSDPNEALTIPRSSVADVYKLIISDLQFAQDNLPAIAGYAAADKGRATKYAAKGILALVYMTRSGPTYDIEGPGLGLNEWSQALALLNEIIANKTDYDFLTGTGAYANIFSYTNENNKEVIFDVQYSTGSNPVVGATFPWVLVPDTWFQSQSKAIQGGLTIRPVSNSLLTSYETGDVRKALTIQSGYTYLNVPEARSFIKKYVDVSKTPSNRLDWPINFIVMRYTDVLMLKAECILHGAPGTQLDVDAIVNQVRARAGLGPRTGVTLPQLMEERRKEFAGEGLRWHDLVRSGLVTSIIPAWITSDDVLHQMQPFKKEYIIYPIPQAEIDAAPGLYQQNSGY